MKNPLTGSEKQFSSSNALIKATSELLALAANCTLQDVGSRLKLESLVTLADKVHLEAEVLELLHAQLQESVSELQSKNLTLFADYPLVSVPLSWLNHNQLMQLQEEILTQIEIQTDGLSDAENSGKRAVALKKLQDTITHEIEIRG